MLNFKEFLTEMFDEGYPIKLVSTSAKRFKFEFETGDDRPGVVSFEKDDGGYAVWELGFTVDGRIDITGRGDAFKILATVIRALSHFLNAKNGEVSEITFSASSIGDPKKTRINLYRRMIKRFAGEQDLEYHEEPLISGINFHIYLPMDDYQDD